MSSIPYDVFFEILPLVSRTDLVAICCASKTLRSCASDFLYKNVVCTDLGVCDVLRGSQELAAKVQQFEVTSATSLRRNSEAYTIIADTLRYLVNLRSLTLSEWGCQSWVLHSCTSQLTSLTCASKCDANLVNFLATQPQIEELFLHGPSEISDITPNLLPNLRVIEAHPSWLEQLLPGRPVCQVTISNSFPYDKNPIALQFLASSTSPIHSLSVGAKSLRICPSELAQITPSLSNLTIRIVEPEASFSAARGRGKKI